MVSLVFISYNWVFIGVVYSWGSDTQKMGILGVGKGIFEVKEPTPVRALIDYRVKDLTLADNKAWAIDDGGRLFVWGQFNNDSMLLDQLVVPQPVRVEVLSGYRVHKASVFNTQNVDSGGSDITNIAFLAQDSSIDVRVVYIILYLGEDIWTTDRL